MRNPGDWTAAVRLTRPRQWPILSAQLAVGVLVARNPALDPDPPRLAVLAAAWLAWVVLLNGGTLAYNSAFDRDTGPVAYLRRPPTPPAGLAGWSLALMAAGAMLGFAAVGPLFGGVVLGCLFLSVLYSHPAVRWKSRPGFDLLVNMVGYGAGTTVAGMAAGRAAGWTGGDGGVWYAVGFALLFGSLYPLTQIYQREDDLSRGDRTLATALGVRPSLALALLLGCLAAALLCLAPAPGAVWCLWALAASLAAWLLHLGIWWLRAPEWPVECHERGMYHALVLWGLVDAMLVLPRIL